MISIELAKEGPRLQRRMAERSNCLDAADLAVLERTDEGEEGAVELVKLLGGRRVGLRDEADEQVDVKEDVGCVFAKDCLAKSHPPSMSIVASEVMWILVVGVIDKRRQ